MTTTEAEADAGQPPAHADDVADCTSAACWAVEEHGWKELVPALPDEVIALVAPPVVVSASPFGCETH